MKFDNKNEDNEKLRLLLKDSLETSQKTTLPAPSNDPPTVPQEGIQPPPLLPPFNSNYFNYSLNSIIFFTNDYMTIFYRFHSE